MQTLFRQIKKPLYPIFLAPGLFLLCVCFFVCSACSLNSIIYYKIDFTEDELDLLRKEFDISSEDEVDILGGTMIMDVRSIQNISITIKNRNDDSGKTQKIEKQYCDFYNTADIFMNDPDEIEEIGIIDDKFGLAWEKNGEVLCNILGVTFIIIFTADMIRCSKWKVRKTVNNLILQSDSLFGIHDIQVINGVGTISLQEKNHVTLRHYAEVIKVFQNYMEKNSDVSGMKYKIAFRKVGVDKILEVTNYNKENGEIYNTLECIYIVNSYVGKLSDISDLAEVDFSVIWVPEFFKFDKPELLGKFSALKCIYADRNLSAEERMYIKEYIPECLIG